MTKHEPNKPSIFESYYPEIKGTTVPTKTRNQKAKTMNQEPLPNQFRLTTA